MMQTDANRIRIFKVVRSEHVDRHLAEGWIDDNCERRKGYDYESVLLELADCDERSESDARS